ncbi:hypothetical protein EN828_10500 [Mesorhizobium sp. M2D.F.Ca.ET.185.01.1.1]|uniref:beta strand repeat-containing protein n=1 Tax=unclassified Mesorhizobium TaxID=325217 RepID=UPI000FC9A199|nr:MULTISPECIES: hypothetical protein [unclassified Mesorhizobium]TGT97815.1 hypothetical protein EN806_48410 [bacterium M00.F.Ca.ET.163.01.1.1]TGV81417.1 hypothetical protein EN792_034765 [Mesorhizobium sp. M00.F.Ca.ET.149.01.1.1]TGP25907.1 hypothetical protein EN875_034420 [Mesorhizobium sp. M2D.F.Ca.ET.232.01.1.1]TGQ23829.1 hypothetical protein EN863_064865 [Mesorhizobium sp. M00.F.Ca.ET.220.01.1.1]TGQ89466.1 hypothetical protein EN849_10000 [Mesorhizobium sp. M2D.F.Ca.ET.206.01.1.1]
MSNKLTALTAATLPLAGTEAVYLVQGGNSRRATATDLISTCSIIANNETITGVKTYNAGKLQLAGSTSGVTILNATAIASGTLTLPAATDTLVARNTTDTLTNKTLVTPAITGTNGAQSTLTAAFNDSSSVAGSGAKFWNPLFSGNAGTAIVHRLNRVLIGEAAANSSDFNPVTTKDWLETLLANTTAVSQLAAVSATGQLAVMGGSRTSDYRTLTGSASGGSEGITGLGYNNDTTAATTPIAAGVVGIGVHASGVNGITLNQMDINSAATTATSTPFNGVTSGSTWALGLTAGAYSSLATQNATGAMYIGAGTTAKFNKGIISFNGALDTTVGAGGGGVTYEAYRGQSFRWLNSSNTVDAEVWGDANGFNVNSTLTGQRIISSAAVLPGYFKNTANAATNIALRLESARGTGSANDSVFIDNYIANSAGTATDAVRLSSVLTTVTAGSETAAFTMSLTNAGSGLSKGYNWTPANYYPNADAGSSLGIAGTAWANLFLANGAVVNFSSGNYTVTHSSGTLTFSGAVLSSGTGGVGYATGAGGTVTQATSRTTGVTLNKTSGAVTMFTAAGSATPASFTVTNSTVAASDTIILNIKSGATNTYFYFVTAVAAGSFVVTFWTTGGTASDTPILSFNVIKGVTA